jgi:hypothetical protein
VLTTTALRLAQLGSSMPGRLTTMHRADPVGPANKPALTGQQEQVVGLLPTGDMLHLGAVPGTIEMIEWAP